MIFDPTSEFQGEKNPGGAWGYGYSVGGGSLYSFIAFDAHGNDQVGVDPKSIWTKSDYIVLGAPAIWRNLTSTAMFGVRPGQVSLHAGPRPRGDFAVLRFTAPHNADSGTRQPYRVTGRFFAGDGGNTTAFIVKNEDISNPLRAFDSTDDSPGFSLVETLSAGDTLDFVVGNNGSNVFGNTPLEVTLVGDEAELGAPPSDLLPASGQYPVERAQYDVLVLDQTDSEGLIDLRGAGPLDLLAASDNTATKPVMGALLTWTQSWYTQGLALGQLLHSLALAPGESTRIAMVDWSRRQSSGATEAINEGEQLFNDLARSRSITEVTSAVAVEAQQGFSRAINTVEVGQLGYGSGAAATGGFDKLNVAGGAGIAAGYAHGSADVLSRSWTTGRRDVSASLTQQIVDRTHQASGLTRSRWATIVKEVSQKESELISTRAVTNFNHMHALTIQYWETVQLYRCSVELTKVEAALFVPMKPIVFDESVIRRFRFEIASAGLISDVRALASVDPGWVGISSPRLRFVNNALWIEAHLEQWARAIGQSIGDASDSAVVLPQGVESDFHIGWSSKDVPIDSVVIYFRDGTRISKQIDREVDVDYWNFPASASFGDTFKRSAGGRGISSIARIAFTKNAPAAMVAQIYLKLATTLAERVNLPSLVLGANIDIPGGTGEFTAFDVSVPIDTTKALIHLNANRDYYSRAIWSRLSSTMVFSLLSRYSWGISGARPLTSQVDPTPIATAGNYLVFRLHPVSSDAEAQAWRAFLDSRDIRIGERSESVIPMPTGGVFAEAVLGRANSAEKIDLTRFWNWQDSPIPIVAPEISAIQAGTRATPDDTKPGTTPSPVLNIVNSPSLPDPTGMAAVLGAVQNGNMFRDMSGLAAALGAAQAGLSRGFDASTAAQAQAAENFRTAANLLSGSVAARGASDGSGTDTVRTTGNLPATPTNLGGLVELGRNLDRREGGSGPDASGPSAPTPEASKIPVKTTHEKAMLYGTGPTAGSAAATSPPDRVLQFFVSQENSNIVVPGTYQFEVSDPVTKMGKSFSFVLGAGSRIGKTVVTLNDGHWDIEGTVQVRIPDRATNIPVNVMPGVEPVSYAAERSQLNDGQLYELAHHFAVEKAVRVVNLHLRPKLEKLSVVREIELSAEATTTVAQNTEVRAGLATEGSVGVAQVSASGSVAVGASFALTGKLGASQKLELRMDFWVLRSIEFDKTT
jgi:hypothetical protein